ncbi:MAG: UDP-N-acetylglucosamine 1-carboxyvinyltransferase, partial [Christensenellaceae bacterium]|nr:UDP-N-acetylglucosamine 1-carboxyvinyltransferase [Christensenellaceae bacterium]
LLGAVTARLGEAEFCYPGGCDIGRRPVDQHLAALRALGAEVWERNGLICCRASRLQGGRIRLACPSVGATENAMLAAVLAKGDTVIENAAREPEIADLAALLCAMGARVSGAGGSTIRIRGVERLGGAEHVCMADRIECGTFMAAVLCTGGRVLLKGPPPPGAMAAQLALFRSAGLSLTPAGRGLLAECHSRPRPVAVCTRPHPGLPTDMQPQLCAVAALADGQSRIRETVFEDRFRHAAQLAKTGADIRILGREALICGRPRLFGAHMQATDLRGGAAMVLLALAAEGRSTVENAHLIDRGYMAFEQKLTALGADIRRR